MPESVSLSPASQTWVLYCECTTARLYALRKKARAEVAALFPPPPLPGSVAPYYSCTTHNSYAEGAEWTMNDLEKFAAALQWRESRATARNRICLQTPPMTSCPQRLYFRIRATLVSVHLILLSIIDYIPTYVVQNITNQYYDRIRLLPHGGPTLFAW